jgi:hypothetical protein
MVRASNPPPAITSFVADRTYIYPPTNKMVDVNLSYSMTDNCDTGLVSAITVSSNQPTPAGAPPDWEVVDSNHVRVRARVTPGSSFSRVYTITLTVTDSSGAKSSRSVNVIMIPVT